jgi:hypothetical protein
MRWLSENIHSLALTDLTGSIPLTRVASALTRDLK